MQDKINYPVILSAAKNLVCQFKSKKKILRRFAPQKDNGVKFFRSLHKQVSTFLRRLFQKQKGSSCKKQSSLRLSFKIGEK
jgi:hypothetical protein